MTHGIRVHRTGGPEVLQWESIADEKLKDGEVYVRNHAIGMNFLDIYHRTGRYPSPLPYIPGHEGAGIIEEVGPGVTGFKAGDRVAYFDPMGAYAQRVVRPANRLVKLPDSISYEQAAAMMLKGVTACFLIRKTFQVKRGDTILVQAAAGGVGRILCQWAKHIGATVIGTVGSEAKREIALKSGCTHVLVGVKDFAKEVRALTDGKGVPVVYDGVGRDTFMMSLDCLRPLGYMVAFGAASGPIPLLDVQSLAARGSLFVTRPGMNAYTSTPETLAENANALFDVVASGAVSISIDGRYPLKDAAKAQDDLEQRRTTGSNILLP